MSLLEWAVGHEVAHRQSARLNFRGRYFMLLIDKARATPGVSSDLCDRIERLIGSAPEGARD